MVCVECSERSSSRGDSVRTRIGNYAYEVRNALGIKSNAVAHWVCMVYKIAPTEKLVNMGAILPSREDAVHNALEVIGLYSQLDRMKSIEPSSPRCHAAG